MEGSRWLSGVSVSERARRHRKAARRVFSTPAGVQDARMSRCYRAHAIVRGANSGTPAEVHDIPGIAFRWCRARSLPLTPRETTGYPPGTLRVHDNLSINASSNSHTLFTSSRFALQKGSRPMLTRNQRLSIFLLVSGYSNSEVAAEIGVTPRTIRRWMKIKLFAQTLEVETRHACEAARAQAHCTARRLMDNATAALRALQPILLSDRTDPKVIVRAADITLRNATRWLNVLEDEPHVPTLQMESPDDVGAENEIESEAQQTQPDEDANADELTRCPTMREEEVAQIDAIRRKMDGQYPDSSGDVGSAGVPRLPSLVLDGDTNTTSGRRGTPALPTP